MVETAEAKLPPQLYRMIIDLSTMTLTETQLSDYAVEFPVFNHTYDTCYYQFIYVIYAPAQFNNDKGKFNALLKYDLASNSVTLHDFGSDYEIGEAYFAPRLAAKT